ncbi:MAG: hypothetical protein QNK86_05310, partial [Akkermansiaceae bacterium]
MKYTTITTLAALLLGTAGAFAQSTAYTMPSGFVTHTLKAGQFNLIGLTLHSPITVSGAFETVSGTTLTDTSVDFTTALTAGKTYILEITENTVDPSLVGTIQEITSWTATMLTTPQDLDADGLAGETAVGANDGAKYQLRAATTISDVFGATNTAGLEGGTASALADNIYLPNSSGGFDIYYYSTGGFVGIGWRKVGSGSTDFSAQPLVFVDGLYVFRRGAVDLSLVNTGSVKVSDTTVAVTGQFTFVGGIFPVGSTLDSSKIKDSVTGGTASSAADNIMVQNSTGGF